MEYVFIIAAIVAALWLAWGAFIVYAAMRFGAAVLDEEQKAKARHDLKLRKAKDWLNEHSR